MTGVNLLAKEKRAFVSFSASPNHCHKRRKNKYANRISTINIKWKITSNLDIRVKQNQTPSNLTSKDTVHTFLESTTSRMRWNRYENENRISPKKQDLILSIFLGSKLPACHSWIFIHHSFHSKHSIKQVIYMYAIR